MPKTDKLRLGYPPPPPACLAENYDAAYHLGKEGVQLG